ncbi:MAG: PHP domain-containing protein [Ruminococcaceae bacterium]|nr:PHP domain-containing protein [Oscillospiraceae bacterium]
MKMEKLYANLHMHSTHSDGPYSPKELVRIAKEEGYKAMTISDHDTASAYTELKEECDKQGMECIFSVEFTVRRPYDFHIVGFDFDPEYPPIKEYLKKRAECETYTTKKCFEEALETGGIKGITWEEVLEYNKGIPWLCNNHVFRAMKAKGLIEENQYMEWFNTNFCNQRSKYKKDDDFLPLKELVKLINEAGGFAICAHPQTEQLNRVDLLKECGIVGLEVLHPRLNEEERIRAYDICIKNNWFISGGSDHCGLCGGYYDSYPDDETLKNSYHYIEKLSVGVYEKNFREIQTRTISSDRN